MARRVLVAVASRHGATREIADAIAGRLGERGLDAEVRPAGEVGSLDGFDAIVIGSAVYVGRWLEPARRLAEERGAEMAGRPVWAFSSGPVGEPPRPDAEDAVDVVAVLAATGARDHRLFPGRIDRALLGFGERAVVRAVRAAEGDFRDWAAVEAWADEIAAALAGGAA